MEVTSYQLREAIKRWRKRRDALTAEFNDSIYAFSCDNKRSLSDISIDIERAEESIVKLESVRSHYNSVVETPNMVLIRAIKTVGYYARLEALWRSAASQESGHGMFGSREMQRSTESEYAKPTVARAEAIIIAERFDLMASKLRSEIATANATELELDLPGLDQLLE